MNLYYLYEQQRIFHFLIFCTLAKIWQYNMYQWSGAEILQIVGDNLSFREVVSAFVFHSPCSIQHQNTSITLLKSFKALCPPVPASMGRAAAQATFWSEKTWLSPSLITPSSPVWQHRVLLRCTAGNNAPTAWRCQASHRWGAWKTSTQRHTHTLTSTHTSSHRTHELSCCSSVSAVPHMTWDTGQEQIWFDRLSHPWHVPKSSLRCLNKHRNQLSASSEGRV